MSKKLDPDIIEAGKRASDIANNHLHWYQWIDIRGKFLAFKLADGSSDGVLYDSKRDAVRHQIDERICAYFSFRNCPNGTTAREMAIFLQFCRDAYDSGFRLTDPDDQFGGKEVLMTAGQHDYYKAKMDAEMRREIENMPDAELIHTIKEVRKRMAEG